MLFLSRLGLTYHAHFGTNARFANGERTGVDVSCSLRHKRKGCAKYDDRATETIVRTLDRLYTYCTRKKARSERRKALLLYLMRPTSTCARRAFTFRTGRASREVSVGFIAVFTFIVEAPQFPWDCQAAEAHLYLLQRATSLAI